MALPSNGNYYMQSEDTDSANKAYFLISKNGNISYDTSSAASVNLQAVTGSAVEATLAIGSQYLGIDENGNAVLSTNQTRFTISDAGTDSGSATWTVEGSWVDKSRNIKTGDLSIPSSGTAGSSALAFSAPPSGGPTKASKKQKWVFKTIQSPADPLVK